jgi:hypothetical protein
MATTQFPNIHTQAGARWLAPFLLAFLFVILTAFVMLVNPYFGG